MTRQEDHKPLERREETGMWRNNAKHRQHLENVEQTREDNFRAVKSRDENTSEEQRRHQQRGEENQKRRGHQKKR